MNQQAIDNRAWLQRKLEETGLDVTLMDRAAYIASAMLPAKATWFDNYSRAYSDGHNSRGLSGKRLDHYACAFADICEEVDAVVPELHMTLDAFWLRWDSSGVFEGSEGEHWHFA